MNHTTLYAYHLAAAKAATERAAMTAYANLEGALNRITNQHWINAADHHSRQIAEILSDELYEVANAYDSQCYRFYLAEHQVRQLTVHHPMPAELIYTEETAQHFSDDNVPF